MNPFLVLNLPRDCSDEDVRAAYHRLLRENPPESNPVSFQQIHEAAESLKSERARKQVSLTYHSPDSLSPMQALTAFTKLPGRRIPPGLPAFKTLLRACASTARDNRQ
jgi:hypothetical protein